MATAKLATAVETEAWGKAQALMSALSLVQDPTVEQVQKAVSDMTHCFVGVTEIGRTNTGFLVDQFGRDLSEKDVDPEGIAWCILYVQACYLYVCKAFGKPDLLPYNTASSQGLAAWAEKNGLARTQPKYAEPGSVLVLQDGQSNFGHGEIINASSGKAYTSTGGNTSGEGSRDGGAVCIHRDVLWAKWGSLTPESDFIPDPVRRHARCVIPVSGLIAKYWSA